MRKENAKSSDATKDTEAADEGSFLKRWSQLKRRARLEESEKEPAAGPAEEAKAEEGRVSTDAERVLTDEDMPPLESLNADSDYSGFMSPGVSESLRKLALRKMFLSSKYNITDGLDDYAEDFTKFAPLGNIITSDMRHQMEMEAEKATRNLEEETRAAIDGAPAAVDTETEAEPADAFPKSDAGEKETDALAGENSRGLEPGDDSAATDDSRGS